MRLIFENYKPFRSLQELSIKPLTILIGRNNAGKSVLARLPLMLARSLSENAEAPIELQFNGLDFGASFKDLIHNRNPHGAMTLGMEAELSSGELAQFSARIQHFDEYKIVVVNEFSLSIAGGQAWTFKWIGKDPIEDLKLYQLDGTDHAFYLDFRGLFPTVLGYFGDARKFEMPVDQFAALFANMKKSFAAVLDNLTYLGPFRKIADRSYNFSTGTPLNVGALGDRAPDILGIDFLRNKGALVQRVGDWIAEHLGGWRLIVSGTGDTFELSLQSPRESSLRVNLRDVGAGIGQVLALVVQRHLDSGRTHGPRAFLEIVEQPELHLHPAAHGDLADLYINAIQANGRFLIETHSENFILRVRRRIAEGLIKADDVAIVFVDDSSGERPIREIDIDERGEVNYWPVGIFSEDFEEVAQIREAQRASSS